MYLRRNLIVVSLHQRFNCGCDVFRVNVTSCTPSGDRYSANVSISHNVHKLLYPSSDQHQSGISFSLVWVHCWWLAILVRILQCVRCCQLHSSCSREASHRWCRPVSSVCCSVYCSDLIKTSLLLNRWHSVPVEAASLMNFVPEEVVQVSRSLFLWTLFLKKLPLFHELKFQKKLLLSMNCFPDSKSSMNSMLKVNLGGIGFFLVCC